MKAGVYGPPPELLNRPPITRSRLVRDKIGKIFMKGITNINLNQSASDRTVS
ncbi:unnamed protein product [Hymenolepis diminuta]|uniref:Uncharacterized protein n=1 Tax=Hymenolepis diminuta TaxID=6216 RepID=A0A564Y9G8_HYMDI|nr:unnamed protein product [Hymenolepis diminuta]